jgi:hypothetical protein
MRKSPAILPGAILKNFIGDLQSLDYTAFNTLFSDGRCLLATREANENNAWVKKGNLCEYYYTLYHGASKDGKQHIICSQELPINGIQWSEIPNHAMVCIDLATGKKEIAVV